MRDNNTFRSIPKLLSWSLPVILGIAALSSLAACGGGDTGLGGSAGNGATGSGTGSGSGSGSGTGGSGSGGGGSGGGPSADPCAFPHDAEINVADAKALTDAIAEATPGTLIRLAPGTYTGKFDFKTPGAADKPIVLCGPREAIIDGGDLTDTTAIRLLADYHVLSGFTITNARKGIAVEGSNDSIITNLLIHTIGEPAVHIRRLSSRTTVSWCEIRDTGLNDPKSAEAIYVGTDESNWDQVTGSPDMPDASDQTKILNNKLGPGIKSEPIDIKEGTTGGEIRGNIIDGTGMTGEDFEDSWVVVSGNNYIVAENHGKATPRDGFQVRAAVMGWGNNNTFEKNVAEIEGSGFGINVEEGATGTVVKCDNQVVGAMAKLTNLMMCTP